jgi:hypothetical protein
VEDEEPMALGLAKDHQITEIESYKVSETVREVAIEGKRSPP